VHDRSPEPARTGIWIGLAAITMSFAALTSALIVRQGAANDWRHITLPVVLYFNTLVLLASSITLELSRRRVAAFMRAANAIYEVGEGRPVWKTIPIRLGVTIVNEGLARWTYEGRTGYGISEYLHQLDDDNLGNSRVAVSSVQTAHRALKTPLLRRVKTGEHVPGV